MTPPPSLVQDLLSQHSVKTARNVVLAYQGLRALVDCGAIMSRNGEPTHLKAAVAAGWAHQRSSWTGKAFAHLYVLKIDRDRAVNILAGISDRMAA